MARIVYSNLAVADFKTLLFDLDTQAGRLTALKYRDVFRALFRRLETFPEAGAPRPNLGDDMRIAVIAPYLVIYRPDPQNGEVQIHRIIHGRRNITRRLLRNVRF